MNQIWISGGNGLLAAELIRQLSESGDNAEIVAVSANCDRFCARYRGKKRISCVSWEQLEQVQTAGADVIIHCAFSRTDSFPELYTSLSCTGKLLKKAGEGARPIPFIGISSRSVYGQNLEVPWTEQTPVCPNSPYAFAKAAQEQLTAQMAQSMQIPYTNIRLAGLVGPGMEARLLSQLIRQALELHRIRITGGAQLFAMLDLRDAAAGILALLQRPAKYWKPIYNLGPERAFRLDEIAEKIKQFVQNHYDWKLKVDRQEKDIRLIDGMDCSVFCQDTGWQPQYSLDDTIQSLFQAYGSL